MPRLLVSIATLAAVVLLTLAPAASAITITIEMAAEGPEIPVGGSDTHAFSVSVASSDNFVCVMDSSITLTVEATKNDEANGLTATVAPSTLDFSIDTGAHTSATGAWSAGPETGTLTMNVGNQLTPGHAGHQWGVKASFDGTAPTNCQPADAFAETEQEESVDITIMDNRAPPDGGENGGDDNMTNGGGGGDNEDSPLPTAVVLTAVALAMVGLRRRRA